MGFTLGRSARLPVWSTWAGFCTMVVVSGIARFVKGGVAKTYCGVTDKMTIADPQLQTKCRQLLARRESPASPWYYLTRDWKLQLFFLLAYASVAGVLWWINWRLAAVTFLAFFAGRVVRDVKWWNALAKEWPTTEKLIDWELVERLANGDSSDR